MANLVIDDEKEEDSTSDYSQSDSESEDEDQSEPEEPNLKIKNSHEIYLDDTNQFDINESQLLDLLSDLNFNDLKNTLALEEV